MKSKPGHLPAAHGLYDPQNEHDACGVGFVAHIKGHKSHSIIEDGLDILKNLAHRGATGCDPLTSDGAGILIQIPHLFFAAELAAQGVPLPAPGQYGVGMFFLPNDAEERALYERIIERTAQEIQQPVLAWRDVPVDGGQLGWLAKSVEPVIRQAFFQRSSDVEDDMAFERKLYLLRRRLQNEIAKLDLEHEGYFYVNSLSCRTVIYKGLLMADRISTYFLDLQNPTVVSALALVHQRFSTNTFPTWDLAHPFRYIAHNGEINTLRGNRNWMVARQARMTSEVFGEELKSLFPLVKQIRLRLRHTRQRDRTALSGRAQSAPCHDDAHSGGVGQRRADVAGEEGVLRVPRLFDGALGRSGGSALYGWRSDRSGA